MKSICSHPWAPIAVEMQEAADRLRTRVSRGGGGRHIRSRGRPVHRGEGRSADTRRLATTPQRQIFDDGVGKSGRGTEGGGSYMGMPPSAPLCHASVSVPFGPGGGAGWVWVSGLYRDPFRSHGCPLSMWMVLAARGGGGGGRHEGGRRTRSIGKRCQGAVKALSSDFLLVGLTNHSKHPPCCATSYDD